MPDKLVVHTEDLGNTEYDGNRRARAEQASEAAPTAGKKLTSEPVTATDEARDVALAQKDTDEIAVVRRQTEI
ncbi:hypothetical protein [Methylobacterium sp. CM6247]